MPQHHRDRTTTISMPSTLRPPSASCAANVLWTVPGQLFEDIGAVRWQSPFHLKTLIGRIVLVSLHNRGFILASPFHFLVQKTCSTVKPAEASEWSYVAVSNLICRVLKSKYCYWVQFKQAVRHSMSSLLYLWLKNDCLLAQWNLFCSPLKFTSVLEFFPVWSDQWGALIR